MGWSQAGSLASRRLLAPRAIRPIRAFNRYEDIPGRKLTQSKGIKYRLDKRDNKKPITSEEAMCLTVSKQLTDDTLLFAPKNISTYLGAETDIQAVVELSIDSLKEKKKVVSSFDTPQIVVLTQDTLMVTKLYKALRDKYALSKGLAKGGIEVRVWKLFARHIPIKDQEEALKVKNEGQIINVFIGTPNRIKALASNKVLKLESSKLRSLIFDCTVNNKGFTLFETHEPRDDTINLMLKAHRRLLARKLKIYLA